MADLERDLNRALYAERTLIRERHEAVVYAQKLEEAIDTALNELGVPDEHYPAPVVNAVNALMATKQMVGLRDA